MQTMLVVLHLGCVTMALAFGLFARGLKTVSAAMAVTLTLAEPLTASTLGIVVLGERLTFLAIVGIGFLFSGLVLLSCNVNFRR
jgi:DME family drug/metabolite transporter